MPIPAFSTDLVLPPHLGDPRDPSQLSPYRCSLTELCKHFGTSADRRTILEGFLNFRQRLTSLGVHGFQWLDGSFLEDVETREGRSPGDIDVVTFYQPTSVDFNIAVVSAFPEFRDRGLSRVNFHVDHFPVDIGYNGFLTVDIARYWTGLFSHRRGGVWKGMLRVELNSGTDDVAALATLAKLAMPPASTAVPAANQ